MMTSVAICVDDFGLHGGVNQAALELARAGRVTAISAMVGAPAWVGGAAALAGLDPDRVDVGLHLDLTEYLLQMARPGSLARLVAAAYTRRLHTADLVREIQAQFDVFEAALGRPPSHLDGHQHVHQLPQVRDAVMQVLHERAQVRRLWLRSTRRAKGARRPIARGLGMRLKPLAIEALGEHSFRRMAGQRGYPQNGHLLGVYDFEGDASHYLALLRAWLEAVRDGDLIMCHAACATSATGDPILAARIIEHQALAGPEFDWLLRDTGVILAPLSRILRSPEAL
jgi:predicted glycoside hydrolase/deacetylase ChbG (UPF0249 family)